MTLSGDQSNIVEPLDSFVEGRKHGDAIEVDASGTRLECVYVEGERHGDFKEYDANGKLIATGVYNMGKRSNK